MKVGGFGWVMTNATLRVENKNPPEQFKDKDKNIPVITVNRQVFDEPD